MWVITLVLGACIVFLGTTMWAFGSFLLLPFTRSWWPIPLSVLIAGLGLILVDQSLP
jgi:hypothetical protein